MLCGASHANWVGQARKTRMSENTLPANAAPIAQPKAQTPAADGGTTFAILVSLSFCHMLNDLNQSLVPALYPILKDSYRLDFAQIGLITLAFQLTASMLQPVVGFVTDKRPQPFSLPIAMTCSLVGLLMLRVGKVEVVCVCLRCCWWCLKSCCGATGVTCNAGGIARAVGVVAGGVALRPWMIRCATRLD